MSYGLMVVMIVILRPKSKPCPDTVPGHFPTGVVVAWLWRLFLLYIPLQEMKKCTSFCILQVTIILKYRYKYNAISVCVDLLYLLMISFYRWEEMDNELNFTETLNVRLRFCVRYFIL